MTIEIEPQMIAGSRVFYPANRRVFDDKRSTIVIDDAKSFFASAAPAVRHHHVRAVESVGERGVRALHDRVLRHGCASSSPPTACSGSGCTLYEIDDGLVLSVMAAIHQNFRSYEVYLVPSGDLLIVASNRDRLPAPDWSVFEAPGLRSDLCHFAPLTAPVLDALSIAGRRELAPLLDSYGQPNSDYYPVLDLGAERRRFRHDRAMGFPALSEEWFNLLSSVQGRRSGPGTEPIPALPENPRVWARSIAALIRTPALHTPAVDSLGPRTREALFQWNVWQATMRSDLEPTSWERWLDEARAMDDIQGGGTAGTADEQFYTSLTRFMDRHHAPQSAKDVVAFRHGLASWNFVEAAEAGQRLLPVALNEHRWVSADDLRDGLVFARLHLRDATGARQALDTLAKFSTRPAGDLRSQLLGAYVVALEGMKPEIAQPLGATPARP